MRRARYVAMKARDPYRIEGLSSRSAMRLANMLWRLTGDFRAPVTPACRADPSRGVQR